MTDQSLKNEIARLKGHVKVMQENAITNRALVADATAALKRATYQTKRADMLDVQAKHLTAELASAKIDRDRARADVTAAEKEAMQCGAALVKAETAAAVEYDKRATAEDLADSIKADRDSLRKMLSGLESELTASQAEAKSAHARAVK